MDIPVYYESYLLWDMMSIIVVDSKLIIESKAMEEYYCDHDSLNYMKTTLWTEVKQHFKLN